MARSKAPGKDRYPPNTPEDSSVSDRRRAYVLDASALLAMLLEEPGAELVMAILDTSLMSSVNWSEVIQKALAHGIEIEGMQSDFRALGLVIVPFSPEEGETAARLWQTTRIKGLSLGDRACLALSRRFDVPALTADRAWADLELDDLEIQLIRP